MMTPARFLVVCCALAAALLLSGCEVTQSNAVADTAAEEKAIRDTEGEWSKAAAAKDVDRIVSYYAEDGTLLAPNAPIAMGKPAIRVAWTGMMALPGISLNWAPMKVEVAKSGDIAYSFGAYNMVFNDPQGKATSDRGKYVVAWKKQPDNTWKAVADIFNSDLPAPAATQTQASK